MNARAGAWLRLVRAGMLFSPGADVVAGLCLAGLPWSGLAVRAVLASVCLYAGGMALNDHADRAEDAVHRPERPLPAGRIAPGAALALGLCLLALGVAIAPHPLVHAGMAALVLLYDYVLKSVPPLGALAMGALRALNLASGALAVPVWTSLPAPVLAAAAAYGVYVVAVTVLGMLEDVPEPPRGTVVAVQLVPPAAAVAALLLAACRAGNAVAWVAPAVAFVAAMACARRALRVAAWTQREVRVSMTWLLLGTMLYTGLLCVAAGRWPEGLVVLACIAPARWIARRIALT